MVNGEHAKHQRACTLCGLDERRVPATHVAHVAEDGWYEFSSFVCEEHARKHIVMNNAIEPLEVWFDMIEQRSAFDAPIAEWWRYQESVKAIKTMSQP